ncbi:MAG: hypothetical protein WCX71_01625 [Candidatus Buchananbacteria bacterium]
MKEQNNQTKNKCCSNLSWPARIIKILLIISVLFVFFVLGFCAGIKTVILDQRFQTHQYRMGYSFNNATGAVGVGDEANLVEGLDQNQNYGLSSATKIAGEIKTIEGTKIGVIDNGQKPQIIYSGSDTIILNEQGEVGLSYLKAGQFITAVINGQDKTQAAQVISVSNQ